MSTPDPSDLDRRARRSAARLHDDVISTVELAAAERRAKRPSRGPAVAALSIAAIVAIVAAVFVVRPDSGDVEVAIDEDGTTTTEPDTPEVPDIDSMPAPIALGAPDDGKDSVGLPVDADPKTDLTDGQMVTVTGAGFPPSQDVGVVMCTKEAGQEHGGRGVDACDIGHFVQARSDGQGNVSAEFSVRRFATLDGQEIDCASEAGRCIIGMGLLSDYDQSGGVAVDFDPDVPAPEPPTASLTKTDGIADGETVDLALTGLVPNSYVFLEQCTTDGSCMGTGGQEIVVDGDGTYSGPVRLWRVFGAYGMTARNVDCAVEACQVRIQGDVSGGRTIDPIDLGFDPDRGQRTAPTMRVLDEGPFTVGSTFSVEITGLGPHDYVDLSVCSSPERECAAYGSSTTPPGAATQEFEVSVTSADPACATGCPLTASIFSDAAQTGDGPPPLFPEPVMVTITG